MPILGGTGNASEYAYRSFIVNLPNPFDWIDLYDVDPGQEYRSGYAKITGIKSKLPLRVSIGSSYSLISNVFDNGQTVTFDNNKKIEASFDEYSTPNSRFKPGLGLNVTSDYIRNNQSINLSIIPPKIAVTDFSKTYTTTVSVGKSVQDWIVRTRAIDDTPNTFSFTSIGSTSTQTTVESNIVTLSGLEPGFSFASQISSGIGTIVVNGNPIGTSFNAFSGDLIKLQTTSSSSFNTQQDIVLKVGTYSTTWSVKTEIENLDITFTPTSFTDVSNVDLSINQDSNQITLSGFSKNSTLPLTVSNANAKYEVERNAIVVKAFDASPVNVINNDKIRLRLTSSASYSTAVSSNMKVGNTTSADWNVTTRSAPPPPPPPPPDPPAPPPPPCVDFVITYRYGVTPGGCGVNQGRSGYWYKSTPSFSNHYYAVWNQMGGNAAIVAGTYVTYLNRPIEQAVLDAQVANYNAIGLILFQQSICQSGERASICPPGVNPLSLSYTGPYTRPFPTTNCGRSYTSLPSGASCGSTPTKICSGTYDGSSLSITCSSNGNMPIP